jgi:hypothetical protein
MHTNPECRKCKAAREWGLHTTQHGHPIALWSGLWQWDCIFHNLGTMTSSSVLPVYNIIINLYSWSHVKRKILILDIWELNEVYGLMEEEITRGQRELHIEVLHNLHSWESIIKGIKLRGMIWLRHAAWTEKMINLFIVFVGIHIGRRFWQTCTEIGW